MLCLLLRSGRQMGRCQNPICLNRSQLGHLRNERCGLCAMICVKIETFLDFPLWGLSFLIAKDHMLHLLLCFCCVDFMVVLKELLCLIGFLRKLREKEETLRSFPHFPLFPYGL